MAKRTSNRIMLLPTNDGIKASSAAGSIGTFDLPVGFRYHKIQFVYIDGGSSPADMKTVFDDDIIVWKNNTAQRLHTATELERLNVINGSQYGRKQVNTGAAMRQTMTIFFAEPWRKSKVDTDSGAWIVTSALGWNKFQVSLKLAQDMPSTGSLVAYAWYDDALALPANTQQSIKKVYREQITASGLSLDVKSLDNKDDYQTVLLKHPDSAGYITEASFKRAGVVQIDQVKREDMVAHLTSLGLNPADSTSAGAFGYEIVFDADDPKESVLPADGVDIWMQLKFNTAASGNVYAMVERVGPAD